MLYNPNFNCTEFDTIKKVTLSTHIYNKVFNEYLGLWEQLNNPNFKGVEFDPLLKEAGSNAFTTSLTGWVELTNAVGIVP